jgi:hypothetical protein
MERLSWTTSRGPASRRSGPRGPRTLLSGVWNYFIRSPLSKASNALTPWSRAAP